MNDSIFTMASWFGSIAFALSGYLIGVRKNLDIMGIFIVALLTANGGGVLRDVLVGRLPSVLQSMSAFFLVAGVIMGATALRLYKKDNVERHSLFVISDSLGLVAFSLTGALLGIQDNLSVFGVMTLSFITATGGGILRDILLNEVPLVLKSDFYGSISILMAGVLYGLHAYGLMQPWITVLLFVLFLVLRVVAWKLSWGLPKIRLS
jgi:uncharacterized membrane protein YeiH